MSAPHTTPTTTHPEIQRAVDAAVSAFSAWSSSSGHTRARLLEGLALALESECDLLVALADRETHLGTARLQGELARTTFQLRRFAALAQSGAPFSQTLDPAVAGAPPVGHPHMVRQRVPLGPVAMFAASNFPFAFSVLGGDTASALAAGCTVVVKAHPGHPRLSERVGSLARSVLQTMGVAEGTLGLVQGDSHALGAALVCHPGIAAAAFTGSTRGGLALQALAQSRPTPIPFYGELGAINPVLLLPAALAQGQAHAEALAASITQGCGQFCTNPGLLVVPAGLEGDRFVAALAQALEPMRPHAMLTPGMRQAFAMGTQQQLQQGARALLGTPAPLDAAPHPFLAEIEAERFIANPLLHDEVFGPSSLVVRVQGLDDCVQVLQAVRASLTVTLLGAEQDTPTHRTLVRVAAQVAGRVLFKGVPTGVAVCAAQQHGGPWPASTAPMSTSVGDAAMERFLRPVCLQDAPTWLLERHGVPL